MKRSSVIIQMILKGPQSADTLSLPDIKMQHSWSHRFSESFQSELRSRVEPPEGRSYDSKMAAIVDNVAALPRFHAWQHSLDQPQGTKEIHFEQFLGHVDRGTLQCSHQGYSSIVNC